VVVYRKLHSIPSRRQSDEETPIWRAWGCLALQCLRDLTRRAPLGRQEMLP